MGCLNSEGKFDHWFGNIHLSGPCNRSCYFCIGQHMMALDPLNVLDSFPLPGLWDFIRTCEKRGVREINLTGSNTDPLMYQHHRELTEVLRDSIPNAYLGIRTNGVLALRHPEIWNLYDKASISITSLDKDIYRRTMGCGEPPDLERILALRETMPIKVNVVLCPETVKTGDIFQTLSRLADLGIRRVNLREPYGQPHIGSPMNELLKHHTHLGMSTYEWAGMWVTYWDVHYVEVESVNLYANGRVSVTYPVTKGHTPKGVVQDQEQFVKSGRVRDQWVKAP